jgi:hypothetical protein
MIVVAPACLVLCRGQGLISSLCVCYSHGPSLLR